jgi:LuxR family maltose regulon positive regulatory protein
MMRAETVARPLGSPFALSARRAELGETPGPRLGRRFVLAPGKLSVPRLPVSYVRRVRVEQLISKAARHHVALLCAPAGFGRTVALAGWARRQSGVLRWLSLDESDNDSSQLWRSLVCCLDPDGVGRQQLAFGERSPAAGLELVLELLEVLPVATLVLDDVQALTDPALLERLNRLAQRLPAKVGLVLSSRSHAPLALERLRAQGEVGEIGPAELAFDHLESAALLSNVTGVELADEDVHFVLARTRGWAAGLQFAADALREQGYGTASLQSLEEDAEWVRPYFEQEVLSGLRAEQVRLLELAAVAERLEDERGVQLGGDPFASAMAELCERGVFLERSGDRYRCHPLLVELLRRRLEQHDHDAFVQAHRRAARRCQRAGELGAALAHLEAAGDDEAAHALLAEIALDRLERGEIGPVLPVVRMAERESEPARAVQVCARVLSLIVGRERFGAEQWLRRLRAEPGRAGLEAEVELLGALLAWLDCDGEAMRRHAGLALARAADPVPPGPPWLARLHELVVPLATAQLVSGALLSGEDQAALRASEGCGAGDAIPPSLAALRAVALAGAGQLREAHGLALAVLESIERSAVPVCEAAIEAHLALGRVSGERMDFAQCLEHLDKACQLAEHTANPGWLALVSLERVTPLLAADRSEEAFALIAEQRAKEAAGVLPKVARRRLELAELAWRLHVGDVESAGAGLRALAPWRSPVLEARLELVAGRPERAAARLEEATRHIEASLLERVERLVILARAASQMGLTRRSRDAVHRAVELARPEWLLRPFAEHRGSQMLWLLESLRSPFPDPYLDHLIEALAASGTAGPRRHPAPAGGAAPVALVEGLTEREREALSLLPSHLSQQEIAGELFVSVNTLKTHLRGLYRKLGATSRSEAVAAARLHGLV